jgi:hypothetical protein
MSAAVLWLYIASPAMPWAGRRLSRYLAADMGGIQELDAVLTISAVRQIGPSSPIIKMLVSLAHSRDPSLDRMRLDAVQSQFIALAWVVAGIVAAALVADGLALPVWLTAVAIGLWAAGVVALSVLQLRAGAARWLPKPIAKVVLATGVVFLLAPILQALLDLSPGVNWAG